MDEKREERLRMEMELQEGHFGVVISKLRELLKDKCNLPKGAKEDLKSLATELRRLQAWYWSMPRRPVSYPKESQSSRISKVRKVWYDAENLLDDLLVNPNSFSRLLKNTSRGSSSKPPNQIARIKQITQLARTVFDDVYIFADRLWVDPHKVEAELVGMDGPRDILIKTLTEGDDISKKQRKVVSILGSPILGKTTLAQVVCHRLKPQFDCGVFVRAPLHPGKEKSFFIEMLSQLDVGNRMNIDIEAMDERQLISQIGEFLQDKRYLILIDDLWNEDDWHSISCSLPNNDYGSRVITTTRFNDIANLCCSGCDELIYKIQHLGYLDSKRLFLKQFVDRGVSWPNAPMDLSDEILEMCGGMPLAIIRIASLLATRKPLQGMMNSVHSAWKQTTIVPANIPGFEDLKRFIFLAYLHLPSSLKDCLLYLVVHAENQMVHRITMAKKWTAEGFTPEYGTCSCEEVASPYFDELVHRNFVQLVEHGNYLGEEIYEVKYMVLQVLRQISHDENFVTVLSDSDVSLLREYELSVRLSIKCSGSELSIQAENMDRSRIRSISIVGATKFYLNKDLVYMRVLDIDGCKDLNNSAMDHICRMLLLKYLSLKNTQVTEIPPEIRKLQNLETLDVRQTQVKEMPKELVQLPKLAHLYFGQCSSPQEVKLPVGSDQLKSVKVLGTIDSREWSGSAMEEISGLTGVTELEVVLHDQPADKDQNDKLLSSIGMCKNLKYLIIYGDYNPSDVVIAKSHSTPPLERLKMAGRCVKVPRWLAQLTTLKMLDVKVCKLDQDDLNILGRLPSLRTLSLALVSILRKKELAIASRLHSSTCTDSFPGEETCPAGFKSLEVFDFDCHVPWITLKQRAMPSLKQLHLKLYACQANKYPSGIINLRKLEKIILRYSSHYASSRGVTKAVAAMREEAARHGNLIELSVNGRNEFFPVMREEASSSHVSRVQPAKRTIEIEECN